MARPVYSHGSINPIIGNIKKKPRVRYTAQWSCRMSDMRGEVATTLVRQGHYR